MRSELHRQYPEIDEVGASMTYGESLAPDRSMGVSSRPDFSEAASPHVAATDYADEQLGREISGLGIVSGLSHMRHGEGFVGLGGIQSYSFGPDGVPVTVATGVANADAVSEQTAMLAGIEHRLKL